MNDLRARVAYLQGLASGLDFPADSKEGRLLNGIVDVLTDFAEEVTELSEAYDRLEDYVETLDEDLYELEDEVYYYDDEHSFNCHEDDEEADLDDYVEVDCPSCGETVMFNSDILENEDVIEVICPNCDEVVFVNEDQSVSADEPKNVTDEIHYEDEDF